MPRVGKNTGGLDRALRNVSYFYNRDVRESSSDPRPSSKPMLHPAARRPPGLDHVVGHRAHLRRHQQAQDVKRQAHPLSERPPASPPTPGRRRAWSWKENSTPVRTAWRPLPLISRPAGAVPCYLLCNVAEEAHQIETIPFLRGRSPDAAGPPLRPAFFRHAAHSRALFGLREG